MAALTRLLTRLKSQGVCCCAGSVASYRRRTRAGTSGCADAAGITCTRSRFLDRRAGWSLTPETMPRFNTDEFMSALPCGFRACGAGSQRLRSRVVIGGASLSPRGDRDRFIGAARGACRDCGESLIEDVERTVDLVAHDDERRLEAYDVAVDAADA